MGYTTGISKEAKKLLKSNDPDMLSKLSPEDKAILDQNVKNESMKLLKKLSKNVDISPLLK